MSRFCPEPPPGVPAPSARVTRLCTSRAPQTGPGSCSSPRRPWRGSRNRPCALRPRECRARCSLCLLPFPQISGSESFLTPSLGSEAVLSETSPLYRPSPSPHALSPSRHDFPTASPASAGSGRCTAPEGGSPGGRPSPLATPRPADAPGCAAGPPVPCDSPGAPRSRVGTCPPRGSCPLASRDLLLESPARARALLPDAAPSPPANSTSRDVTTGPGRERLRRLNGDRISHGIGVI